MGAILNRQLIVRICLAASLIWVNAAQHSAWAANFVVEDAGEYGYRAGISEDARRAGQVAPEIVMFRYMGKKGERHSIRVQRPGPAVMYNEWTCTLPCRFPRHRIVVDGAEVSSTVSENVPGSLGSAVWEDVAAGALKPYPPRR